MLTKLRSLLDNKVKILVIDDDENSNLTLKMLLEEILSYNCEIDSLYRGDTAVEQIENNIYDLVFLDNKLPGMDGLDVLKQLKKKGDNTNIIFLTGYSDEEIAVKAMKLGAIDYISKGNLDVERLIEAINEIIADSCSMLDIPVEILSEIKGIFSGKDEIVPRNRTELVWDGVNYRKELMAALDKLVENNYLSKRKIFSAVACPTCDSLPGETYIACPVCGSLDLSKGEVIEHNKCHYIDYRTNFVDEKGNFICPKCGEGLRQIGVDYVKVGVNYKCNNGHIFPYPEHRYVCIGCGKDFNEDESKILDIYEYKILDEGKANLNICANINSVNDVDNLNSVEMKNVIYEKVM